MTQKLIHLIDDDSAGGVNRMLDHLEALGESQRLDHEIVRVRRGAWSTKRFAADVIVSHVSICWRNLPMLASLRALNPSTPLVHVEHSYSAGFVAANEVPQQRFYALLRASYALFDTVIAVSQGQADWLKRRDLVNPVALRVMRPCVDLKPFFELPQRSASNPTVVGMLGRLDRQKGFDIGITAFCQGAPDNMVLHIYGDGPERARLEALACGHPRVRFMGFAAKPAEAMAQCDVITMPSRWEPFGLVGLEAQAAGRPLICSGADGLIDHRAGEALVIPGHSVSSWAETFALLDKTDLARRALCGRRHARAHAERFDTEWRMLVHLLTVGNLSGDLVRGKTAPADPKSLSIQAAH